MNCLWANFFPAKDYKPNCEHRKVVQNAFHKKAAYKMLVKLTSNLTFFASTEMLTFAIASNGFFLALKEILLE